MCVPIDLHEQSKFLEDDVGEADPVVDHDGCVAGPALDPGPSEQLVSGSFGIRPGAVDDGGPGDPGTPLPARVPPQGKRSLEFLLTDLPQPQSVFEMILF